MSQPNYEPVELETGEQLAKPGGGVGLVQEDALLPDRQAGGSWARSFRRRALIVTGVATIVVALLLAAGAWPAHADAAGRPGLAHGPAPGTLMEAEKLYLTFPMSFEGPYLGSCPYNWICTGEAKVCRHPPLSVVCVHPGLSGVDGRQYLSLGGDKDLGSATSMAFYLPPHTEKVDFKRSGGAGRGSGFYLHLLRDDSVICSSEDSVDTNAFSTDSCMGVGAFANQAVYINLRDRHNTSWGKVLIDDIRLKDKSGADIETAVAIPSPMNL